MTTITIPGDQPLTIDLGQRRTVITEHDARRLTAEIQHTSVRLWFLVTEAHDRKAHQALGYQSWDDYARTELKMSPSRSYQLLDTGHVMKALAKAGADLDDIATPPARIVARVKDRLPEVQRVTRAALKDGSDPDQVLRELARQPRIIGGEVVSRTVSTATAKATTTITDAPIRRGRRPSETVVCPVCVGEGKVSKTMAKRVQAFLRKK